MTQDTATDAWLTLAQAAEQLGISVHAVRRRVKAGELTGRQVPTKHGTAWRVQLDGECQGDATVPPGLHEGDVTPAPGLRNGSATVTDVPGVVELVALVRDLQAKLEDANAVIITRTEAAAMWQERAGLLSDRLALAESKMAALEAAQEPESATLTASTAEHAPDPVPESSEPESPWWKRWLTALYGW